MALRPGLVHGQAFPEEEGEDASLDVGSGRFIDASVTDLLIGALFTGGDVLQHFAGLIDEVSIYNRALSAEEIQAIFNAGSAGKCKEAAGGIVGIMYAPSGRKCPAQWSGTG
jgi:hypothetical protein